MAGRKWGASVARALLACAIIVGGVWVIRLYGFASFRISTGAMEEALRKGDRVIVSKLPLAGNPGRNRAVLFYSPLERDSLRRPLFVSRCVGMPGDTIRVSNEGYRVNGLDFPFSPQSLRTYFAAKSLEEPLAEAARRLGIPLRDIRKEAYGTSFELTPFEAYQLADELGERSGQLVPRRIEEYTLIVPREGRAYPLTPSNLLACREIIRQEQGAKAEFRDGKLFLEGKETFFYFFDQDYYWVLSDNMNESVDSRHLGFIPARRMVGNILFRWYSEDKSLRFKPIH